jgi:hypothetical protein
MPQDLRLRGGLHRPPLNFSPLETNISILLYTDKKGIFLKERKDSISNSLNFNLWKNNPLRRFYNFLIVVDKLNA